MQTQEQIVLQPMPRRTYISEYHEGGTFCMAWCGPSHASFQRAHDGRRAPYFGFETLVDQDGRAWERGFSAVIGDFGDLVEVPR